MLINGVYTYVIANVTSQRYEDKIVPNLMYKTVQAPSATDAGWQAYEYIKANNLNLHNVSLVFLGKPAEVGSTSCVSEAPDKGFYSIAG